MGDWEERKERLKKIEMLIEKYNYGMGRNPEERRILHFLNEFKAKAHVGLGINHSILPERFTCPASARIHSDGQTYNWSNIQNWLNEESTRLTCPLSEGKKSHPIMAHDCLMKALVLHWCILRDNDLEIMKYRQNITEFDQVEFNTLLEMLSGCLPAQKEAAKELRIITDRASYGADFGKFTDGISRLLSSLLKSNINSDPALHEDVTATLLNLSSHERNKKVIADHPGVIPFLLESMGSENIETARNSAATVSELSLVHSNKFVIGHSGAPLCLLQVLHNGHLLVSKIVASTIFTLCLVSENRAKFNELGAVEQIMKKIKDGLLPVELSKVLSLLTAHDDAEELGEKNAELADDE